MFDLTGFLLPFVFVLAITYGALDIASVFKKNAVNLLIAVVIAFFAVSNAQMVQFVTGIMPWAAMLFIVIFFIKFIASLFRGAGEKDWTMLMAVLGLIAVFMLSQGTQLIQDWLPSGFPVSEDNMVLIIGLVIIIAIFFAAYKNR